MSASTPDVDLPNDLVERVLNLPPAAMRKLVDMVYDVLEEPGDDPEVVRKEWQAEIARRIEGYLDGTIPAEDAEVSFNRVWQEFLRKHPQ